MSTPCKSTVVDIFKKRLSFLGTSFHFKKEEIEIYNDPETYYNTLKSKISNAENRIFMATLYIGKTETELIECINTALEKNTNLKVYFLVDALRGTREAPSNCSAKLLAKLAKNFDKRVDIRFYQTPAFVGWKKLIPKRFNEGLGLQHMKIYGFDDEVILSGANLSNDYFTNRQDRYFLFKSGLFSQYYFELHQLISSLSYKLKYKANEKSFSLFWPTKNITVEPRVSKRRFLRESSAAIESFLNDSVHRFKFTDNRKIDPKDYPTTVYPISQLSPLFRKYKDHSTEKKSILQLIAGINDPQINWTFTAGYFNMLPEIEKSLLSTPSTNSTVITASPYANGFYQSKGVSKHLPDAYLLLSKKFLQSVKHCGKENSITLREWQKGVVNQPDGWSYHAKGLWLSTNCGQNNFLPFATVIGSSNYTRRAYSLDLESNALILTEDKDLQLKLQNEISNLVKNTKPVTLNDFDTDKERQISSGVKLATSILGKRL